MTDFAIRYDSATIELIDGKEDEKFLRCRLAFARTGVFPYVRSDGKILREAKLPEDLFSPQTIESAKGRAATDDHPPISDNEGLISDTNYNLYAKGAMGDSITHDDRRLWAYVTIWDKDLKKEILDRKKVEVSVGFRSKQVHEPGTFEGEDYDLKQTNIRFNHVAFVEQGRAGEEVRVYLDSADIPRGLDVGFQKSNKEENMKNQFMEKARAFLDSAKSILDSGESDEGKETPVVDENQNQNSQSSNPDSQSSNPGAGNSASEHTKPKGDGEDPAKKDSPELELLKTKIQLLESLLKEHQDLLAKATSEATQDSLAMKRMRLIDSVKAINPKAKTDGVSSRELKKLVVAKAFPESAVAKQDSMDPKILDGYFEAAMESLRVRANDRTDTGSQPASQDSSDIATLKNNRASLYKEV